MKKPYNLQLQYLRFFKIYLFLLFSVSLQAQLEVAPGNQDPWNPQNLIENVFLGEGVEVSNITYTGVDGSVGYFQNGSEAVGLERGIILSTGFANHALGPNDDGGLNGGGGTTGSTATCPELGQLTSFDLDDIAAYEITFTPVNDTLRFRYVFASEEYPEFGCSSFNDVFGFFISGPNPNGGTYASENIALIPELSDPTGLTFTNLPVAINNVNGGVGSSGNIINCTPPDGTLDYISYYNGNQVGSTTMQFDGYLDVFTAQAIVTPCQTYTIKLAVGDAVDSAYDTAVFLEAKSFGTGQLEVTAQTVSLDGTLVEGCENGALCFEIPTLAESDIFIDYNLIGSAINGVDYETIPLDLFIAAGDSMICFPIIPIEDGMVEINDSLGIDVQIDPCTRDTFWIFIQDAQLPDVVLPADTMICNGDSVYVDATLNVVLPAPPVFSNMTSYDILPPASDAPTLSDIMVSGVFPLNLQEGTIKSVCIDSLTHRWDDDLEIFLFAPGGEFIELSTRNGANGDDYINTCFSPTSTNPINVGPNNQAPASAAPFTGTFMPEGDFVDLYGSDNPTNGTWQLFIYDRASTFIDGALHSWSICFEPVYKINYAWSPAAGLSCADCPDPWMKPDVTTTYTVTVTDTYGCSTQDSITIEVQDLLEAPTIICSDITSNSINFTWNDVGATGGYEVNVNGQGWIPANGTLQHFVDGLVLNQTVVIEVRGIGDCPGAIGTETCMTPDCPAPTGSISNLINVNCFGENTGSATVTGMGVNSPFTYAMNSMIDADGIFDNLPAGDYNVQVIDNLSCAATVSFTILQPDSLASVPVIIDNISCNSFTDGEGTVTVVGGTAPYNFAWTNGDTDSISTNLIVGENILTITDALGCQVVDTILMTQPDALSVSIVADSVNCFGGMDGEASAIPVGGTTPYIYAWSDTQTDSTATGLAAQNYEVTVTDANGCIATSSIAVEEYAAINLGNSNSTQATCSGIFDGTATILPTGGGGNYTYAWQDADNQTTQTAIDLTSGTYTVIVSDQFQCTASTTVTVTTPDPILAGQSTTLASCFDSADGSVTMTPSGGTPDPSLPNGYTFTWSEAGGTDNVHNFLPAGNHSVTITDLNGCFEVFAIEILAPAEIDLMLSFNEVNCGGGNDGEASVQAVGGNGGYLYQWSAGTNVNSSTVNGLSEGFVFVTVEDASGCTQVDSIEVTSPNVITLLQDSTVVDCNGNNTGSATVDASNGAGNFTYAWDVAAMNQTTSTAIDLTAGTYEVTVTDANMCSVTTTVEVTEPAELATTILGNDAACFGDTNGNSTVTPTGGTGDYTYQWSDANNQTTATAADLIAQATFYYVTVTDANQCTTVDSILINSPAELTLTLDSVDVLCFGENGGSATATAGGGAGNFTYAWSDDNNQTTSTANNLTAGTFTVTVTDMNNCSVVQSIDINEPTELILLEENVTNVLCNGENNGTISLENMGGTAPYNFNWSNGMNSQDLTGLVAGTYTLEITDANLCQISQSYIVEEPEILQASFTNSNVNCFMGNDGSIELNVTGGAAGDYTYSWTSNNGFTSTERDIENLMGGDYTILITDQNNCTFSETITITQPSTGVSTSISPPVTICFGATDGTATVTATGGTPPYAYAWNDPNNQTTATANNLPAGTFTVTVTDQSGCTFTEAALVNEQPEIIVSLDQTSAECFNEFNGTATVTNILYGNNPANLADFTLQWNTSPAQNSATANNLQGGNIYEVVVTNSLGCTATAAIEIGNPDAVLAEILTSTDITCFGGNDGTATATGVGGVLPYTYFWSANAGSQEVEQAINLAEGNYLVTVSDANGCNAVTNISIDEPTELEIDNITITDVECFGENSGRLAAAVSGGTSPYSFLWSNGTTTSSVNDLLAGTYNLTVTDANGCTVEQSELVQQPALALAAQTDTDDVTCFGGFDGQIFFFPEGGTPPYSYSIDGENFSGSATRIGIYAGTYDQLQIRDSKGCVVQLPPVTVNEAAAVTVDLGDDITLNFGQLLVLDATVENAVGDITYNWLPSDDKFLNCTNCPPPVFADSLSNQTIYEVIVTDENGCTANDLITIFVKKFREVLVPTGFSPDKNGANDLLLVHGRPGTMVKRFRVYDRWGELVYEAADFEINSELIGWDGTLRGEPLNPSVFVWICEVEYEDGEEGVFKGETTLVR